MAHDGKIENWGSGSRRSPQRRAENSARRSQKRAGELRWRREEEGRRDGSFQLPAPADNLRQAFAIVQQGLLDWKEPPSW